MLASDAVNAIIKQVCTEILLPLGVFQKGTSRTYIDDNGCFFTIVEFQPSAYAKGTYLNVALHFLWNERDALSLDFPFGNDVRIGSFVEYQNDEQFTAEVRQYAQEAVKKVLFYRNLQEFSFANGCVKKWVRAYKGNERIGELDTICRPLDREVLQKIQKMRTFWRAKPSMRKMKTDALYDG